jgi:hypothetical protein
MKSRRLPKHRHNEGAGIQRELINRDSQVRFLRPMRALSASLLCLALPAALLGVAIRASLDPVKDEPAIAPEEWRHWAFAPLRRPDPPMSGKTGARTEIDRFILAKLEAAGHTLSPPADAATLIRRVTFDLTGLPPTPEQVRAFASDPTDSAYEALVDRLLASSHYGEAQALPWLDLARFAETDGFEHDIERKHAWKYRDWVIKALNDDMAYDEFVRRQVAGDLLNDGTATGFLVAGPDMPDLNIQDERRHFVLNDMTSTVGGAFLGLTMSCAQCHDHPYDPVSQADFYRLRAFFDGMPEFKRDKQLGPEVRQSVDVAPVSKVFVRGDFRRAGPQVQPAFPRIANRESAAAQPTRLALAEWLTRSDNALILRVAANRLWQQHFGRGLAGDPNDFGHQGQAPTHPELLDWLATELPRQGWSLKKMHKLIVMSAVYRQSSLGAEPPAAARHLYAQYPRRRLTGEALRDAMLFTAGLLNTKAGGPSVRLPLPPEVSGTLLKKQAAVTEDATEHDRRSIYTFARRNLRYPLFDLFDRPDALMTCGRRNESTTAPQALLLFNSEFSQRMAQSVAERVLAQNSTDAESLATATVWQCLGRAPSEQELALGRSFLEKHTALTTTLKDALSDYCLALLNSNAFVWVD